ncbi:hypothetical protein EGW08_021789 [Elysia chlorotica]|uniref:Uncharacterized protein n=1 Tax=Elysia chlorotica TaxID=188477 RepID=A0A3S1AS11_ELYCH|nr:hypothetical protein EGW08_021789 [Elysia chlorotica]
MDPVDYVTVLSQVKNMSNGANLVKEFLELYPDDFFSSLCSWIQFGEERCDICMLMIYMIKYENKEHLLTQHFYLDQTVLHLAATFHECQRLVTILLETAPTLAYLFREGPHAGLTPLHIIVSKGDFDTTKAYFKAIKSSNVNVTAVINQFATGSRFYGTVLMGETALSASILKFVPEEISPDSPDVLSLAKLLLEEGAGLSDQNSRGDTVIHTLIRYAHLYPERREQVLDMIAEIQSFLLAPDRNHKKTRGRLYARRVWFCQNANQMTALQLAATLGEHEIVCFIMELQWIYRTLHDYDGIFETNKYDITEIDTLAKIEWCKNQGKNNMSDLLDERQSFCHKLKRLFLCHDSVVARKATPAILEIICEVDVPAACNIISTPVVNKLIDAKWHKYKIWFYAWAVFYTLSLVFLSFYASLKFRYVHFLGTNSDNSSHASSTLVSGNITENPAARVKFVPDTLENPSELDKLFVTIGCFYSISVSLVIFYLEAVRTFVQHKSWNLLLIHHNGSYRLILLLNALALSVDSVWFLLSPTTNSKTPMVLALLFGWWFSTFFLRPFKKFSFFTVMLIKVLVGDMLRFFSIIIIALISFTMAMHILFLNSESLPKEFESWPLACLTMFKLMLGLSDLEILEHADPVWLAVTLFVIYVLLTYVLLINSLIAMMSSTCSEIAGQKSNQWKMQRLSVILFIENMMLCGLAQTSGRKNYFRKNDEGNELEARYVIEDTKLSMSLEGGNKGHDIQLKEHYVVSLAKQFSPTQDIWSLSDNLSELSSRQKDDGSNVSLAESFVKIVGKKYRQASRRSRSRSSTPISLSESSARFGLFSCCTKAKKIKTKEEHTTKNVELDDDDTDEELKILIRDVSAKGKSERVPEKQGSPPSSPKAFHKLVIKQIKERGKSDGILTRTIYSDNGEEIEEAISNGPEKNRTALSITPALKDGGSAESVSTEPNNNAAAERFTSLDKDGLYVLTEALTHEYKISEREKGDASENEETIELYRLPSSECVSSSSSREVRVVESYEPDHRERLPSFPDQSEQLEFIDEVEMCEQQEAGPISQETIIKEVRRETPFIPEGDDMVPCSQEKVIKEVKSITPFIPHGKDSVPCDLKGGIKVVRSKKPSTAHGKDRVACTTDSDIEGATGLLQDPKTKTKPVESHVSDHREHLPSEPFPKRREKLELIDEVKSEHEEVKHIASAENINAETEGETGGAKKISSHEQTPEWEALLQSIRNLDHQKRVGHKESRKIMVPVSKPDARQRRNAFIKGLGSSKDFSYAHDLKETPHLPPPPPPQW